MAEATVVIATRNRLEHVRKAVASVAGQTADLDVLVMDDGSTDATVSALREEFPAIRVEASPSPRRQMAQRNRAFELVSTEFVICLDDDAYFDSPQSAKQTLSAFSHPRVAAVTMPYVNVRRETFVRQAAPAGRGPSAVGVFAAGACAFRRSAFLAVGGYDEGLEYQGEEGDLALRLVAAGHVLLAGGADPLMHREASPVKPASAYFLNARNEIYLTWIAVPQPYLISRTLTVAGHAVVIGVHKRHPVAVVNGVAVGLRMAWHGRQARRPVPRWAYTLVRDLRRHGLKPLDEILAIVERQAP